uniref:6-phosphofructo-2-kinase domain-containing protein n=1 Tax=Parascaris equorum TaxID=6256 RepID=A0A914RXZ1_PAREQ
MRCSLVLQEVKVNSPDYKGLMSEDQAKEDFTKRIENYKLQYQPLDEEIDDDLSVLPHEHSSTSAISLPYQVSRPLNWNFVFAIIRFQAENVPGELRIWSSQKVRAAQTACELRDLAANVEYWKVLDEIDAGICEGLTYDDFKARYPKQFADRDKDKYHYRYPSGEAVLRCILAYFDNKSPEELPYLNVPLHTVIKLTPKAYSCHIEMFKFKVDAVDTYREKPSDSNTPLCR